MRSWTSNRESTIHIKEAAKVGDRAAAADACRRRNKKPAWEKSSRFHQKCGKIGFLVNESCLKLLVVLDRESEMGLLRKEKKRLACYCLTDCLLLAEGGGGSSRYL